MFIYCKWGKRAGCRLQTAQRYRYHQAKEEAINPSIRVYTRPKHALKEAYMKTITRSNLYLPITAMILTAALANPAAAQKQVPFDGAMQGDDTDLGFTNSTVTVLTVGKGIGTLLG